MTANTLVVRNLVGVVLAITLITVLGLAFGRRHAAAPSSTYEPPDRVSSAPTPERGAQVFQTMGCLACHTTDGSARVGPSLARRWGTMVALRDGAQVTFDADYVRESLVSPQSRGQAGYPPSMPSFDGILKARDIAAVTEYLKSL